MARKNSKSKTSLPSLEQALPDRNPLFEKLIALQEKDSIKAHVKMHEKLLSNAVVSKLFDSKKRKPKAAKPAPKVPLEHDEQVALCKWLDYRGIGYFAVPNYRRQSPATYNYLKAEGYKDGAPDLVLLKQHCWNSTMFPGTRPSMPVAIEMKRRLGPRGGKKNCVSEAQQIMHAKMHMERWVVIVAYGAEDAIGQLTALGF